MFTDNGLAVPTIHCAHCQRPSSHRTVGQSGVTVRLRSAYRQPLCGSCYLAAPCPPPQDPQYWQFWRAMVADVCRDSQCGHERRTNGNGDPRVGAASTHHALYPAASVI